MKVQSAPPNPALQRVWTTPHFVTLAMVESPRGAPVTKVQPAPLSPTLSRGFYPPDGTGRGGNSCSPGSQRRLPTGSSRLTLHEEGRLHRAARPGRSADDTPWNTEWSPPCP